MPALFGTSGKIPREAYDSNSIPGQVMSALFRMVPYIYWFCQKKDIVKRANRGELAYNWAHPGPYYSSSIERPPDLDDRIYLTFKRMQGVVDSVASPVNCQLKEYILQRAPQFATQAEQLSENLKRQAQLMDNWIVPHYHRGTQAELSSLVSKEAEVLFGDEQTLQAMLRGWIRFRHAAEIAKSRKYTRSGASGTNVQYYDLWYSSQAQVEADLRLNFRSIIDDFAASGSAVRVLDLGCDSGVCAKQLYSQFGDLAEFYGVSLRRSSLWPKTLEATARAIRQAGWYSAEDMVSDGPVKWHEKAVSFRVGHAQNLSRLFPEGHFNVVYSRYGIMYAPDLTDAMMQCHNILQPKGLLAFHLNNDANLPQIKAMQSQGLFRIAYQRNSREGRLVVHLRRV